MGSCCKSGCCRKQKPHPNRKPTREEEEGFQIELQKLFDEQGEQGVLLTDLEQQLGETDILQTIHKEKLQALLHDADIDGDKFVTYSEFMAMYNSKLTVKEKWAVKTFIGPVIHNILPWEKRHNFLANYDCRPPPIFMIIISIIEVAVFIWYAVELNRLGAPVSTESGYPKYSPLVYRATRRYEAWRYLSYLLIHDGYLHLITNLLCQLLLGTPLEIVHEWWRVFIIYFCGVIGGSLAHSITDHSINLVGASGGVYAIIGAHVGSVIVNWKEMNYKCCDHEEKWRCALSAPVRLVVICLMVCSDTGQAVYKRFFVSGANKVGISAHFGGLATGVLLGVPILRNVNELPWEKTAGVVTMCIFFACVIFAVLFNIFYSGYPEPDWTPCCPVPANISTITLPPTG